MDYLVIDVLFFVAVLCFLQLLSRNRNGTAPVGLLKYCRQLAVIVLLPAYWARSSTAKYVAGLIEPQPSKSRYLWQKFLNSISVKKFDFVILTAIF
ncbi:hypothetical protein A8C75_18080 [Marinobacterium aestuarii]|uniref:Uncharacterized protein n=1 Tax=Marinobacterium aestuarii TaxID=1821621 RepID=A0A1A9F1H9_9GAMM|nr:hypothetical protein A8C75_18080 [Marinobacterium aestuarii]